MCVTFLEIDCLKQIVMGEFQGQQRENSYTASISMLQHKIQLELNMRGFGVGFCQCDIFILGSCSHYFVQHWDS